MNFKPSYYIQAVLRSLIIVCLLLGAAFSKAQVVGGKFDKLFDLYAMERYEDCAFKAESYTTKDKTKKEPEPYLYLSMCMYQIYLHINDPEQKYDPEIYKDPLKDALKYAYKFRKKDKKGEYFDKNSEYLNTLKIAGANSARFYYNDEQYRKAATEYSRVLKVDENDDNIRLITGVAQVKSKNTAEGDKNIRLALTNLKMKKDSSTFDPKAPTTPILVDALVLYTDHLQETNMNDSAEFVIYLGRELLPSDISLKSQYNKIFD